MNPDVALLMKAQSLNEAPLINLYDFAAALAPSQAAAEEGRAVDPGELISWCEEKAARFDVTLIEGVGGLMVPLVGKYLVSDLLKAMSDALTLLVVRARLGGINHALLTLDKLACMGRTPYFVIVNDADGVGDTMLVRHVEAIHEHTNGGVPLAQLSHMPSSEYAPPASLQKVVRLLLQQTGQESSD
jgi:dethiobiotin synthetase